MERLTAGTTPDRFWATVGGLGLTGVIVWAGLRLRPAGPASPAGSSGSVRNTRPAGDLEQILGTLSEIAARQPEDPDLDAAAWFHGADPGPGRGLIETVRQGCLSADPRPAPGFRHRVARALHPAELAQSWPGFFGRGGLCRYHGVLPLGAEETLTQMLRLLQASRVRPALVTVRRLGPASAAPLSLAMPGWSLALSFPYGRAGLPATLADLDTLVTRAGGRLDLTQDSWLDAAGVAVMYPDLPDWRCTRDGMDPGRVFVSDLGLRAGLVTR